MSKHAPVSLLAFVVASASCLSSNPQTPAPATPPPAPASAVVPMVPPLPAQPPPPAAPVISPEVQEGGRVTFRLQAPKAGEVTFNVLGDTRAVYVYTPPGYAKDRGKDSFEENSAQRRSASPGTLHAKPPTIHLMPPFSCSQGAIDAR